MGVQTIHAEADTSRRDAGWTLLPADWTMERVGAPLAPVMVSACENWAAVVALTEAEEAPSVMEGGVAS
jgi:hypothetical protein